MAPALANPIEALHGSDSEEAPAAPASPSEIRELLRGAPKPNKPTEYNLREAVFWQTRHVPAGSVITFTDPDSSMESPPNAAVLVLKAESLATGMWLSVRSLGAESPEEKKKVDAYFKGQKHRIHLCYEEPLLCGEDGEDALHLGHFKWFPPGDFNEPWLTQTGKSWVKKGKDMELDEQKAGLKLPRTGEAGAGSKETSSVEQRLGALRRRSGHRVSFDESQVPPYGDMGVPRRAPEAGSGGTAPPLSLQRTTPRAPLMDVKKEVQVVSESEPEEKKKKKRDLGSTLAKAAKMRSALESSREEKKKSRSRSRSKKGKKKRKRRSRSNSEEESLSSRKSSSSDSSLVAPLKRKSQRSPGSVFRMLEQQAMERLAADGVVEEGYEAAGLRGQRPKLHTYYQILLKPGLDPKSRDSKELALLSRTLDLLREGRLAEVADVLAGRLIAVHTATKQGWGTAKHLEVYGEDEDASAPAHVLLSAQRHARAVDKAGGKGSWTRGQGWGGSEWNSEPRPKGKAKEGKGKGKKGKGKGKPGKGGWSSWGGDRDGGADKPKKPENEA